MTKIYVVEAKHWDVPGRRLSVYAAAARADQAARELVATFIAEFNSTHLRSADDEEDYVTQLASGEPWEDALNRLQEAVAEGETVCVEVVSVELEG